MPAGHPAKKTTSPAMATAVHPNAEARGRLVSWARTGVEAHVRQPVKGQQDLPVGGQWNCPSVAIRIAH